MAKKGRPREPAPRVIIGLFYRLLEGPFWVGDWRSTGIKSYSTVNRAIHYLFTQNLIIKEKRGHRILYRFKPPKPLADVESSWLPKSKVKESLPEYSAIEWLHHLMTEKDAAAFVREQKLPPDWAANLYEEVKDNAEKVAVYGRLAKEDSQELEVELTNKQILELLEEAKPGFTIPQYVVGWQWEISQRACLNCLKNQRIWVETRIDEEAGEVVCPHCGFVLSRDSLQREYVARPSPFPPPQD